MSFVKYQWPTGKFINESYRKKNVTTFFPEIFWFFFQVVE